MKLVVIVTIVFFVVTLAGTYLARRSAYSWAANEKSPPPDPSTPRSGATPDNTPAPASHSRAVASPSRAQTRPQQTVVTGFDTPKDD